MTTQKSTPPADPSEGEREHCCDAVNTFAQRNGVTWSGPALVEWLTEQRAAAVEAYKRTLVPVAVEPTEAEREHCIRAVEAVYHPGGLDGDEAVQLLLRERAAADQAGYARGLADGRELPRSVDRTQLADRDRRTQELERELEQALAIVREAQDAGSLFSENTRLSTRCAELERELASKTEANDAGWAVAKARLEGNRALQSKHTRLGAAAQAVLKFRPVCTHLEDYYPNLCDLLRAMEAALAEAQEPEPAPAPDWQGLYESLSTKADEVWQLYFCGPAQVLGSDEPAFDHALEALRAELARKPKELT